MYARPSRSRWVICVASLLVLQGVGVGAVGPPAVDRHGDPLPAGAVARMGTVRLRHGCPVTFVRFLQQDRELVTLGWDERVCVWDATTGRLVRQFGREKTLDYLGALIRNGGVTAWKIPGSETFADLSPDRRFLATGHNNGSICVWEVATAKEVHRFTPLPRRPVWALAFTSGGKGLVTYDSSRLVRLWEPSTGKEIRQFGETLDRSGLRRMAVSPYGHLLSVADVSLRDERCVVRLWDVTTGKEVQRIHLPKGAPSLVKLAFSPDGKSVAWAGDGRFDKPGSLVLYDIKTGKELRQLGDLPTKSHVTGLDFSPDGRLLAGKEPYLPTVRVWDTRTGKALFTLDARDQRDGGGLACGGENPKDVAFSADGKTLAAALANGVRLWDVATGKATLAPEGHEGVVATLAVSPDGKTLTTWGQDDTVRQWEVRSGKEIRRLRLPGGSGRPVFDATARLLAFGNHDDSVRVWDVASGKEAAALQIPDKSWFAFSLLGIGGLAVSPDGRTVATKAYGPQISLWDVTTGKTLGKLSPPANPSGRNPHAHYSGYDYPVSPGFIFSPDGASLLTVVGTNKEAFGGNPPDTALSHWDVRTGKEIRRWEKRPRGIAAFAFSPDGRTVASANTDHTISLWETATGKERSQRKAGALCLAFSPDGRRLAAGCIDRVLRVWDVPGGDLLAEFKGHTGDMVSVAFVPGGRTVLSAGWDTTALAWDLSGLAARRPKAVGWAAQQGEALWADLAGEDAGQAYRVMARLVVAPAQAIPLLQKRLAPAKPHGPADQIPRLIKDLDSDEFATREKASRELENMGGRAETALRNALAARPSLELRQRVGKLLARIDQQALPPEELRAVRCVEVLESISTPEARRLLEALARGAPEARLTWEAKASLKRLTAQSRPTP